MRKLFVLSLALSMAACEITISPPVVDTDVPFDQKEDATAAKAPLAEKMHEERVDAQIDANKSLVGLKRIDLLDSQVDRNFTMEAQGNRRVVMALNLPGTLEASATPSYYRQPSGEITVGCTSGGYRWFSSSAEQEAFYAMGAPECWNMNPESLKSNEISVAYDLYGDIGCRYTSGKVAVTLTAWSSDRVRLAEKVETVTLAQIMNRSNFLRIIKGITLPLERDQIGGRKIDSISLDYHLMNTTKISDCRVDVLSAETIGRFKSIR